MKRILATVLTFLLTITLLQSETEGDARILWHANSIGTYSGYYGSEAVPSVSFMRVCVLYDDRSPLSLLLSRYVKWLFNTMWKIPVDLIDTGKTRISKDLFFDGSVPHYSLIFLMSIIDGENRLTASAWSVITNNISHVMPIVTGLYAVGIPEAQGLFGCKMPKDEDVRSASVASHLLTEDVPETLQLWQSAVTSTVNGGKALAWDSERAPNDGALLVVNEMNVWFGFKDFLSPSPSTGTLASLFCNLLRIIPQGFVRLKIPQTFIALRIDDVPFTTESWFHRWEYFTAEEWRRFFQILAEHNAKCDLLIVPVNISKDTGSMVPYNVTHADVLEAIKEGVKMGVVEIGNHGLTHANPVVDYFLQSNATDPWELTSLIRFEFGYDPQTGQPIPRELQELHLNLSTRILEEWFGFRPVLFTPPWHVWDRTTESILEGLGYKLISADFRFYEDGVRPPSVLGEKSDVSNLVGVPMNYDWDSLSLDPEIMSSTLKPHVKAGIPIVFLSHGRNWSNIDFSILENDARLSVLDNLFKPRYATILEIGDFLTAWSTLRMNATMDGDEIHVNLTSPVNLPVKIEVWKTGYQVTQVLHNGAHVETEGNEISLDLVNGSSVIIAKLQRVESPNWLSNPLVSYGSIVTIILATVGAAMILRRKAKRTSPVT